MSDGLDWMVWVALWVTSLPGAVGRIQAFGTGPLLMCTAGLLIVCLLRTPLRWGGAVLVAAASVWVIEMPRSDVLIADDGQTVAFRGADGRLAVLHSGRDTFAIKEWLAADADARLPKDPTLNSGVRCDVVGCIGKLRDGRLVSLALTTEAFAEDCRRAAIVVSPREAPVRDCASTLVDREVWRAHGAVALRWLGDSFERSVTRPDGYERPWTQGPITSRVDAQPVSKSPVRDAAPLSDDLDADD
jgi:competence protein ComEC